MPGPLFSAPRWSQAQDDRQQDRVSQEAACQRRCAQGRSQESWRVHSYALPLGAGIFASLNGHANLPAHDAVVERCVSSDFEDWVAGIAVNQPSAECLA